MPTAEQLEIRALAREFAAGEIRPQTAAWDAARALDDSIFDALGELGFLGMTIPEEFGGLGLDPLTYLMALEEIAWGDAAVALSMAIQNGPVASMILRHGSAEQKAEWLPRLAAGEILGAFALSEPEAGSDAASIDATAERDGDGWVLNGRKKWITNGARAGVVLVMARTGEGDHEIGVFLVEPSAEGYVVGKREVTLGLSASETVEIELTDVRVGPDQLLGRHDQGLRYALQALEVGRLGIAAQSVGIAQAALEHALRYALEREQFGSPLADFGAVQAKLAEMTTRIAAARALTHEVAGRLGDGEDGLAAEAAMCKLAASETAMFAADEAVQIFGGYGYMRDYPVEKLMRDAKGTEIYEGTNEILRMVIARDRIAEAREG